MDFRWSEDHFGSDDDDDACDDSDERLIEFPRPPRTQARHFMIGVHNRILIVLFYPVRSVRSDAYPIFAIFLIEFGSFYSVLFALFVLIPMLSPSIYIDGYWLVIYNI